ncbi:MULTISPECIES: hypothetical protein [unclassified Acidovorax]|uniref:hypothetical protein n=1 Tax=unclassified Acidovorax TaxID=2684926 RepID=UPI00234B38D4|nr:MULTISPECIES: hypothetical protein [unclassified Acidovorax]WCM95614.1 hypothetical protein M5C96_14075 [Acidovorax sp. GBBC 1281]GKS84274.1 hypothetical protein AVMA1855_09000 [Acidovorax sp. SUPP1855]GKS91052.1 hypothetical protein AVTE2539_16825 [Acidovorax sp. SUPP2539]GKS95916.1 hypothetical protein AVAK2825_15295 [Acidovorax sp. SUPP2825]GKT00608.1 hypothetical protein AVKW3434_14485 [Acidovorax sp. SUPP3434]
MASCSPFNVSFTGSAQDLFVKIAALIHQNGGVISGGPAGGSFSVGTPLGTVAGTFSVNGQTCTVTITQRPFFLPCSTIQSFVQSHIPTVVQSNILDF